MVGIRVQVLIRMGVKVGVMVRVTIRDGLEVMVNKYSPDLLVAFRERKVPIRVLQP